MGSELPEPVQRTEGLVQAAGTASFLGTLGHHTGLQQGYVQGRLQGHETRGQAQNPGGLWSLPSSPTSDGRTHMAHSRGSLDLSDSSATDVTGESRCVPNLQGPVLWGWVSSLVSVTPEPEFLPTPPSYLASVPLTSPQPEEGRGRTYPRGPGCVRPQGARGCSLDLEWGRLTLHADGPGGTAVELAHALNPRESHRVHLAEGVGLGGLSQSENARGALGRGHSSEVPGPAFRGLGTPPPTQCPLPSAYLGDVLDGSCQGLLLCLVLNREVLPKVTEQLPGVGGGSWQRSRVTGVLND